MTKQQKANEFYNKYRELCDEYGMELGVDLADNPVKFRIVECDKCKE